MKRYHLPARPRLAFLALAVALILPACAGLTPAPAGSATATAVGGASATIRPAIPAESRIVIFHSNDIHGKIDNFAKVAAIVDAERKTGGRRLLLLRRRQLHRQPGHRPVRSARRADAGAAQPPGRRPALPRQPRVRLRPGEPAQDSRPGPLPHGLGQHRAPAPGVFPRAPAFDRAEDQRRGPHRRLRADPDRSPATACPRPIPTRSRGCASASRWPRPWR